MTLTDEIQMEVVGHGIPEQSRFKHGSATWRITGPLLLVDALSMGSASVESIILDSFHRFDGVDMTENADRAMQDYYRLLDISEEVAQASLPRYIRATFLLTMPLSEIITHLLEHPSHNEVVSTVDIGMLRTLEESDQQVAAWIRQTWEDQGVLSPASSEEKVAN